MDDSATPGSVTQLIQRITDRQATDEEQFILFQRYYEAVRSKAESRVRGLRVSDADDVAQSVWGTVFRGLAERTYDCPDRRHFEALLGKITYHKAINLYKSVKAARRHPTEKLEDGQLLKSYPMNERLRQVAEMHYVEGQSATAIAMCLDMPVDEVCKRLKSIHHWLEKHRYRPCNHESTDILHDIMSPDECDALLLEELIESLAPNLQETVLLKLDGHSDQVIARELNITTRQVQRRLKILKEHLEREVSDADP